MSAPAPGHLAGPAEQVLAAAVARRFYVDGSSKVQIAAEFDISRFRVARLLEAAISDGVVRIEIALPSAIDPSLSERVRRTFNLTHAVVLDTSEEQPSSLRAGVGELAAKLFGELTHEGDVVGVAWGRSLQAMTRALTVLPLCTVVQLCGALPGANVSDNTVELVRTIAGLSGGRAYAFFAPLVVSDPATARSLRKEPGIGDALAVMGRLDRAFVAVGGWGAGDSTVHDALAVSERRALYRRGARAEMCGIALDADGRPVAPDLDERVIGVTAKQLHAVPEVIGLAYGANKAPAAAAVLRGGWLTGLVTHTALARALLSA